MLNITKERNGGKLTIFLEGRLDTVTAPTLQDDLSSSLDGVTELVIDCEKLNNISSAGLRVLLTTQNMLGDEEKMKVRNVNEVVREVFEITGFDDIVKIE